MKNINSLNITNQILNKYNLRANKRFGQNFLIDDNVLENIVEVSEITEDDLVIEIGPGLGNLTEYLIKKAGHVLLIEIDKNMIKILNDRFDSNLKYTLINDDILKLNMDEIIKKIEIKEKVKYKKVKVVANLPYYITTPIIFKLLQDSNRIEDITVMVQKEVAERMVAAPKSKAYGILTLMVEYLSVASIEIIVPKESFIPSPDVTSAVIKLVKEKRYKTNNEEILFKLIHSAFAQRRKKMINSLESTRFMEMDKNALEKLLQANKINTNSRAEELSLDEYIKIVYSL
jgi:16S rRNA (adenine1518-N6/adenine1519-N6)-dimethyltransferase